MDNRADSDPDTDAHSPRSSNQSFSPAPTVLPRRPILSPEEQQDLASGIRYIHLNQHAANANSGFTSNRLRTAKYTPLNLLPKALFEQFRRVANFYFLIIAVISFIPGVTPVAPWANAFPLAVVVGFGFARDVYEDVRRSIEDARQNSEKRVIMARTPDNHPNSTQGLSPISASVADTLSIFHLDPSIHRIIETRNIAVGDIVFVSKGQVFPADLLLLHSSTQGAVAYASTANLDGESNLKRINVTSVTSELTNPSQLRSLTGKIRAQKPIAALYDFEASITLQGKQPTPLDASNLMLRGSILRNTDYIYGLVVYTGFETKVALNMRHPPSKLGTIEKKLNWVVLFLFLVLAVLVIAASLAAALLQKRHGTGQWYMATNSKRSAVRLGFISLATFLILFSTFIPVSLFVTLEFIRVFQAMFMSADYRMKTGNQPVVARATNLNEMLGEVEHVLSDKTGTLTENVMRYIACSAGGEIYSIPENPKVMEQAVRNGIEPVRRLLLAMALCHSVVPEPKEDHVSALTPEIYKGQKKKSAGVWKSQDNQPDETGNSDATTVEVRFEGALEQVNREEHIDTSGDDFDYLGTTEYQGQSPDEVALVTSAREYGVTLLKRSIDTLVLDHFGTTESYRSLAELEFNSDRKRMSLVLRCPDGKLRLYSKGADAVMLTLLRADSDKETIQGHIDGFAKEGLRTLVFAMKELDEEEFDVWFESYQEARNSLEGREEKVSSVSAKIEQNLVYIATTAVEDKLQDKVPETIRFLREAGVKLWVLTGDKRETAENIGYSANLLDRNMDVVHIQGDSSSVGQQLNDMLDRQIADERGDSISVIPSSSLTNLPDRISSMGRLRDEEKELGLIIDGGSLKHAIEEHASLFMALSDHAKVVICCRVTPLQKALVVRLVREERQSLTLAIGDGGNDVSMIQEAHIGVGIFGKEGTQAARSADYAIGEFKHLLRLTAIHGRFASVRSAGTINLSFYKNIFFTLTQAFFQVFTFASGQTFNNQWVTSAFNVLVTSASPLLFGIFERDLEESTVVRFPSVYVSNREQKRFSFRSVVEYALFYGVWHALVVFFGLYVTFGHMQIDFRKGYDSGLFLVGFANSTIVVLMVLFKFVLDSYILNWIVLLGIGLSLGVYIAVPPLARYMLRDYPMEGQVQMLFSSPTFYLAAFVIVVTGFLIDFGIIAFRQLFAPDIVDRLHEWERDNGVR